MSSQYPESRSGSYVETSAGGENVEAYIPPPLPPVQQIRIEALLGRMDEANRAIGNLSGVASMLPDTPLFLYMHIRKEALLSSQIEGVESSLSELLDFESGEAPGIPVDDVREVSNYVAAMEHGLERIRDGFPISLRLMREIHEILMDSSRGGAKKPGEFRTSQNWIGGSRPGNAIYVPPPPDRILDLLSDLERYINTDTPNVPVLVKAGLIHVQFETIHPFLDGNGRLGRLLITFLLCAQGVLKEPILFPSLFFKTHRRQYYDQLQNVRTRGDWEAWLEFFLDGIAETSMQAVESILELSSMFEEDRRRIGGIGQSAASVLRLHHLLQQKPVISAPDAASRLGLSRPTVRKSIRHLEQLGILREITGKRRDRQYVYDEYLGILERGTEPY